MPQRPAAGRLILFDIDGTLVDTAGAGRRAMERAFREVFGVDAVARRAGGVRFAGMTDWSIILDLCRAVDLPAEWNSPEVERLRRVYLRALRDEMRRPDARRRVLPGVPSLLEALSALDGVFLGLLTGNIEAGARTKLEPFGLNDYFAGGGFGCEHPDRRELARRAHARLSDLTGVEFAAADVVVVGDTEHDVDCALANGFRAVAVSSGWTAEEILRASGPHALLADLSDPARVLEAFEIS